MKLVLHELYKVLHKKVFMVVITISFVFNLSIFYFMQQNSPYSTFIHSEFPSMAEEYTELPLDEAEEKLSDEMKAYEILTVMNMLSSVGSQEEMDSLLSELSQMREEFPDAYAFAEKMLEAGGDTWTRQFYIFTLQQQADFIKSYPDFIGEMHTRADEQADISVFSNQNDFSYKNLYRTAEDYSHLSDRKLSIGNDLPLTTSGEYRITDYILIAIAFLACVYLFSQEREKGLYNLVRSTQNGRGKTIIAKIIALIFITASTSVLFTLGIDVASIYLYGGVDFGRAIQSIADYRNCIFALDIGEFLFLTVCGKALGTVVVAVLLAMLFVVCSNSSVVYAVSATILVTEYLLQSLIKSGTAFNYPKYLNLFYLLDSNAFWGNYVNLNILTNPIPVYQANIFIFSIIVVICIIVTVLWFTKRGNQNHSNFVSILIEKVRSRYRNNSGSTNVLSGELYKYLLMNKMAAALVIVLAVGVVSATGTVSYPYSDISDSEYKAYMTTLQGNLTKEKEVYIAKEKGYYDSLFHRIEAYSNDNSLSESAKSVAINTINGILNTKGKAFERVIEQYNRLIIMRDMGKAVSFIDENLYPSVVANSSREWRNLILLILILIISIPAIFTVDYQRDIIILLRSTKYGKNKLFGKKLILSFATLVIVFVSVYLPYYIRFVNTYGTESFNTPIVCMEEYQYISDSISIMESVVLSVICYFVIAAAGLSAIILCCVANKNHLLSVILSSVVLILPCLVLYPYNNARVGMIFNGNYTASSAVIIALSTIITVICLLIAFIVFMNKRIGGKNRVRTQYQKCE